MWLPGTAWDRDGNESINDSGVCCGKFTSSNPWKSGDGLATLGCFWDSYVGTP